MNIDSLEIVSGENSFQTATIEKNEKIVDYEVSQKITYLDIISFAKGLDIISEFFDVNAVVSISGNGVCAVALGKSLEDAVKKVMDSNPIDFMNSTIAVSTKVESDIAMYLKEGNKIVAPEFSKNAIEILERRNICYMTIKTPLNEYKNHLMNDVKVTPLGTLTQSPNLSELKKDTFKVVSKTKPTVEQIEDAVFAWKVAKHTASHSIVIAKDLKTVAISQGLQSAMIEFAIDYSCDSSKDAILASDLPVTVHDINVSAQGRIGLIIVPNVTKEVLDYADKYSIAVITTGFTNILY